MGTRRLAVATLAFRARTHRFEASSPGQDSRHWPLEDCRQPSPHAFGSHRLSDIDCRMVATGGICLGVVRVYSEYDRDSFALVLCARALPTSAWCGSAYPFSWGWRRPQVGGDTNYLDGHLPRASGLADDGCDCSDARTARDYASADVGMGDCGASRECVHVQLEGDVSPHGW